jgi:radical SAM superfamily enzyme YgiQ (UPF0313 family)
MVAGYARRKLPQALLVGGGPYASENYKRILNNGIVDLCAVGEGEKVFANILNAVESDTDFHDVHQIVYRHDGRMVENPPDELVEDLDSIPFPSWDLIDFRRYRSFLGMSNFLKNSATMMTSRGCPFHCVYCHNMFGKRFRARSPGNVLEEIEILRSEYGIKDLEIVDDFFNADRKRAVEIFKGIAEDFPDVKIAFPNGLRGDLLDGEMIDLMKKAGCWHASLAIESASERIQKLMKKNLKLEKIKRNLRLLKKAGIHTRGFFMIGFPTESREELQSTIDLALEGPLDYFDMFIVSPFNMNELRKMVSPEKLTRILKDRDNIDYIWNRYSLSDIPIEELESMQAKAHRKGSLRFGNLRPIWDNVKARFLMGLRCGNPTYILTIFLIAFGFRKKRGKLVIKKAREKIFHRLGTRLAG